MRADGSQEVLVTANPSGYLNVGTDLGPNMDAVEGILEDMSNQEGTFILIVPDYFS